MRIEQARAGDFLIINLRTPIDGQENIAGTVQFVSDYGITLKNGLSIQYSNVNSIDKLVIEPNVIPPVKILTIDEAS